MVRNDARVLTWLEQHPGITWTAAIVSLVLFVGSLLALPPVVARIPEDYFAHRRRPPGRWSGRHPVMRVSFRVVKNALGVVLLLTGAAMLVLPGQGILTMVVGFLLLDFPGKYGFERRLLARRFVRRPLDWLRRRAGQPPLRVEPAGNDTPSGR